MSKQFSPKRSEVQNLDKHFFESKHLEVAGQIVGEMMQSAEIIYDHIKLAFLDDNFRLLEFFSATLSIPRSIQNV